MRRLFALLLAAAWLVEMSVIAGVEASRRPRSSSNVNVPPTPAPYRLAPQKQCQGPSCNTQPQQLTPSRVIVSPR